jgi:soluble cytochrome b562
MVSVAAISVTLLAQDEKDYQTWMKTIGATVGSLRKNLEAKNSDAAASDAKKLQETFTQVHDFWMEKKTEDAMKFAANAQNGFKEIAELASAGNFEEAQATLKTTMSNCAGCHNAHRVKGDDGSYKIKY